METVEWQLAALISPKKGSHEPKFALLMLNQPVKNVDLIRDLWQRSSLRVAADGGANQLHALSQSTPIFNSLDAIVGDLDSLTPQARTHFESHGTKIVHNPDQESTDFGKAISYIRSTSPTTPIDVAAVGGLGGRVDQGISQLHHLYAYQADGYARGRMYLVSEESLTLLLKAGRHAIRVRERDVEAVFGKECGILPIREPSVISTRGLEWDVEGWETTVGGRLSTSNHVLPESEVVVIETSKDVLFTISLKEKTTE